jgi:hypothetical protein
VAFISSSPYPNQKLSSVLRLDRISVPKGRLSDGLQTDKGLTVSLAFVLRSSFFVARCRRLVVP